MDLPAFDRIVTIYAWGPALAVVISGMLSARYSPGPRMQSIARHVAVGVVFLN